MGVHEYKDRLGTAPANAATAVLYIRLQQCLEILLSHPNPYAGYIEIAAAHQLLYNISINVVVAGTAAFPPVPNPPVHKTPCT